MKIFNKNDNSFICDYCGCDVQKLNYTSRDHCNNCLCSKHIDINPGDRLNTCLGKLTPIGIEKYKKTLKIVYKCDKCNLIRRNIVADDDNMDLLIEISKTPNNY